MGAAQFIHPFAAHRGWLDAIDARVDGQVIEITARMHGRVDRVLIQEEQLIQKGDLLLELDHHELDARVESAAAELEKAIVESIAATVRPAASARQRVSVHSRVQFMASSEIVRARGAREHARLGRLDAEVRAPVAGRVLAQRVQLREYVTLAQPLVSVLEADDLWVLARFRAHEFGRLRLGQPATVTVDGTVVATRVAGLIEPEQRALLEFIARPGASLKPGTAVTAAVAVG